MNEQTLSFEDEEFNFGIENLVPIFGDGDILSDPSLFNSDLSSPDASPGSLFPGLGNEQLPFLDVPLNFEEVPREEIFTEETQEPKKKRGRKRQRSDPNESTDVSAVILTPQQLAEFSTADVDQFARNLEHERGRALTTAERKKIKQQRRRISNRESAQQSRDKKKNYLVNLEDEVKQLKQQNSMLQVELNHLHTENFSLKNELRKLQELTSRMFDPQTRNEETCLDMDMELQKLNEKSSASSSVRRKTPQAAKAGTIFLIVLFSCALFFNTKYEMPLRLRSRASIPQVIPSPSFSSFSTAPKTRQLLELDPKNHEPHPSIEQQHPNSIVTDSQVHVSDAETTYEFTPLSEWKGTGKQTKSSVAIHDQESQLNFAEFMNESNTLSQLTVDDDNALSMIQNRLKDRPNTAFFVASDFHQIIVPESDPFDPQSNLYLSILVPANQIDKGLHSANETHDIPVIEITCQVLEVNQTSFLMNALHHHPPPSSMSV